MTPKTWLALSPEEILGAFEFKLCKYNQKIDREILKNALSGLRKSEIYRVYVECLYEPFMTMGVVLKVAGRISAEINAPFLEQAKNLARALELKVLRCCEDRIDGCKPLGFYENEMRFLEKVFGSWEGVVDNLYYHSADREAFVGQLENEIFLALKKRARTQAQPQQVGISVGTKQEVCAKTNAADVVEVVETKAERRESLRTLDSFAIPNINTSRRPRRAVPQDSASWRWHITLGSARNYFRARQQKPKACAIPMVIVSNFGTRPPKIDTG